MTTKIDDFQKEKLGLLRSIIVSFSIRYETFFRPVELRLWRPKGKEELAFLAFFSLQKRHKVTVSSRAPHSIWSSLILFWPQLWSNHFINNSRVFPKHALSLTYRRVFLWMKHFFFLFSPCKFLLASSSSLLSIKRLSPSPLYQHLHFNVGTEIE